MILFTFRDPLSINEDSKSGCNGENGHLEDPTEDPLDTNGTTSSLLKKKRKSSAEKFLEEQSEYYGFQVRFRISNPDFWDFFEISNILWTLVEYFLIFRIL